MSMSDKHHIAFNNACSNRCENQRLESEIRAGFEYIYKNHRQDFSWKKILALGAVITSLGVAETIKSPREKWYALPLSLASVGAMGCALKLSDKKDLLKVENDILHKVLDFPLYKKDSAYRYQFMNAVKKTKNPVQIMNDFDVFSDKEKAWK